ncbi:GAD-like domain-containing protein [Aquabacterium sp.]|uniref:GAD-like domain-containing protein n=1 Tax=Aquabacterium sp. TaxID=1872578 RepID=UPI003783F7BB
MDKYFGYFYKDEGFGPAIDSHQVPASTIERFRGRLPEQLLSYWQLYGWSGYGQGLFWLVDPDEYEPALAAWIGDTPLMEQDAYYVIARSAFGELFLWGEKSGRSLTIKSLWGTMFPADDSDALKAGQADAMVHAFLASMDKDRLDQKDLLDRPLFDRAVKKLGRLAADEMYAFEPALGVGGQADLRNLRKLKCVEHLVMLAQLGERQLMRDITKDLAKTR